MRNEKVQRRTYESWLVKQSVFEWFGHIERMEVYWLVKRIVGFDVRGVRLRAKPRMKWINGVKRALNKKGMSVDLEG